MSILEPTSSEAPTDSDKLFALFDVDDTLYDFKRALIYGIRNGLLTVTRSLAMAMLLLPVKAVGLVGRDQFSVWAKPLYTEILREQGPTRMEAFYAAVARNKDLHHKGALELVRKCVQGGVRAVLVTGNDAEFVKALLSENDVNPNAVTIFGGQFKKSNGAYEGDLTGANMLASEKGATVDVFLRGESEARVAFAFGDDEGDHAAFEAARESGGICVLVGENRRFERLLREQHFEIHDTIASVLGSTSSGRVLRVSAQAGLDKITLADVDANFDDLIKRDSQI